MTVTTEVSASPDSSWDESEFPPPVEESSLPPDNTGFVNPPKNMCAECGEPVIKEPGQKRTPKYHVECKPQRGSSTATGPRPVRVSAKERQVAEEIEVALERARSGLTKLAMLVALADPYDALVINVNAPEIVENLRPIMYRWPALRETATNASAGASILGLALTVATTLLPILAHHNLIPSKKLTPMLVKIPLIMSKIQERMSTAGSAEDLTEELKEQVQQKRQQQEYARLRHNTSAETVDASTR